MIFFFMSRCCQRALSTATCKPKPLFEGHLCKVDKFKKKVTEQTNRSIFILYIVFVRVLGLFCKKKKRVRVTESPKLIILLNIVHYLSQ